MINFKAILFDLDGVLIDSESIYCRCWMEAGRQEGFPLSFEDAAELRSLDSHLANLYFQKKFDENCYEMVRKRRKSIMTEFISNNGIKRKAGSSEIINYLEKENIPFYIVTSSDKDKAIRKLILSGIYVSEKNIYSGKSVERGKPYPDIYEATCRAVGVLPENTFAVEDAPNGIKSASLAGCNVIMIPDLTKPTDEDESRCYRIYNDLYVLKSMIESILYE